MEQMSVLQDWVMTAPLRAQGTLLTGIRGCDLAPKNPVTITERYGCSTGECSPERHLVAFLRYCVLNPADPREVDVPGAWFQSRPPETWKPSQFGQYPEHWYAHLMHCFEVVGYLRPHGRGFVPEHVPPWRLELPVPEAYTLHDCTLVKAAFSSSPADPNCPTCAALDIYERLVRNLHLTPETREEMEERLTEDRFANDTVVS